MRGLERAALAPLFAFENFPRGSRANQNSSTGSRMTLCLSIQDLSRHKGAVLGPLFPFFDTDVYKENNLAIQS
jgi:hypothetical protein